MSGVDDSGVRSNEEDLSASPTSLVDVVAPRTVVFHVERFAGRVWDVVTDDVDLTRGRVVHRDYVRHTGAVAIVALDAQDRMYLVRQYRHPVGMECWEPPAGLRDVGDEPPVEAAKRELHEEADLTAATWHVLVDYFPSGGGSSESIRVFLARDLAPVSSADRHVRTDEERDMIGAWVPLDEVLAAISAGKVHSSSLLVGAMAAQRARAAGWSTLLSPNAPWQLPPADRVREGV